MLKELFQLGVGRIGGDDGGETKGGDKGGRVAAFESP
jgi:hypothetical protein